MPEPEKAAVGQIKGDVSIMTDAKYQQAINNIVEVKSKTNGGSVNTGVVGNELAVQKVNIKSDIPTAAPVTVTPKVPVPAAASAQMSTLTNQVAQVSGYMALANLSSINANKSTTAVGGGVGNSGNSFWNDTTPPFAKYGIPEIPTTAQIVNRVVENAIKGVFPETISSNVLNGINSTIDKAGEIEKKVTAYLEPDGHTISQFAPAGNIDTMKPYGKITKIGTVMTVVSNGLDIANTWTANSGNTNLQRVEKTGIQAGGMVIASVWGSATVSIAVASGFIEPETGGLSTAGIVFAGTLDVGGAAVINWGQDKLYKLTGIK